MEQGLGLHRKTAGILVGDIFGMTPEQILRGLLENEKAISELAGIIEALREANNDSERLAG